MVHSIFSFHTNPMNMQYYILAVSKNHTQLFSVNGDSITPQPIDGMPTSLADAWKGMERDERSAGTHSTGSGMGSVHGQVGASDVNEQEEDRFIHAVAKSVHTLIHNQPHPLVFAGVAEEFGMFRKFDTSGRLLDEYVQGSPDQMDMLELKQKADPIVSSHTMKHNEQFTEEYGALLGTGRTSTDLAAIEEAAGNGKVDLLLIAEGHETEAATAITHTMEHRGRVAVVAEGKIPESASIAAILRY